MLLFYIYGHRKKCQHSWYLLKTTWFRNGRHLHRYLENSSVAIPGKDYLFGIQNIVLAYLMNLLFVLIKDIPVVLEFDCKWWSDFVSTMTTNWQLKWGDKITVRFAELYKNAECLWNAELPSYQHQPTRKRALLKLIQQLKVDGLQIKQVKQKIKNIRSSYYKELYKIEKSQSAEDPVVYHPSMKWFEILDSFMRVRKTAVQPNSVSKLQIYW